MGLLNRLYLCLLAYIRTNEQADEKIRLSTTCITNSFYIGLHFVAVIIRRENFDDVNQKLTLEAPITTAAADDIHKYFSLFFRENKT